MKKILQQLCRRTAASLLSVSMVFSVVSPARLFSQETDPAAANTNIQVQTVMENPSDEFQQPDDNGSETEPGNQESGFDTPPGTDMTDKETVPAPDLEKEEKQNTNASNASEQSPEKTPDDFEKGSPSPAATGEESQEEPAENDSETPSDANRYDLREEKFASEQEVSFKINGIEHANGSNVKDGDYFEIVWPFILPDSPEGEQTFSTDDVFWFPLDSRLNVTIPNGNIEWSGRIVGHYDVVDLDGKRIVEVRFTDPLFLSATGKAASVTLKGNTELREETHGQIYTLEIPGCKSTDFKYHDGRGLGIEKNVSFIHPKTTDGADGSLVADYTLTITSIHDEDNITITDEIHASSQYDAGWKSDGQFTVEKSDGAIADPVLAENTFEDKATSLTWTVAHMPANSTLVIHYQMKHRIDRNDFRYDSSRKFGQEVIVSNEASAQSDMAEKVSASANFTYRPIHGIKPNPVVNMSDRTISWAPYISLGMYREARVKDVFLTTEGMSAPADSDPVEIWKNGKLWKTITYGQLSADDGYLLKNEPESEASDTDYFEFRYSQTIPEDFSGQIHLVNRFGLVDFWSQGWVFTRSVSLNTGDLVNVINDQMSKSIDAYDERTGILRWTLTWEIPQHLDSLTLLDLIQTSGGYSGGAQEGNRESDHQIIANSWTMTRDDKPFDVTAHGGQYVLKNDNTRLEIQFADGIDAGRYVLHLETKVDRLKAAVTAGKGQDKNMLVGNAVGYIWNREDRYHTTTQTVARGFLSKQEDHSQASESASGYLSWNLNFINDTNVTDVRGKDPGTVVLQDCYPQGLTFVKAYHVLPDGSKTLIEPDSIDTASRTLRFVMEDKPEENECIRVVFKVDDYLDMEEDTEFTNSALLYFGDGIYGRDESSQIARKPNLVNKQGTYNNSGTSSLAHYTLEINPEKRVLLDFIDPRPESLSVDDTVGDGLKLLPQTMKIYENESTTPIENLEASGITVTEKGRTLHIEGLKDETAYRITYDAALMLAPGTDLSVLNAGNTAVISGWTSTSGTSRVILQGQAASASFATADVLQVRIYKTDDLNRPVAGSQFAIYTVTNPGENETLELAATGVSTKTGWVNENNNEVFTFLFDRVYKIVETDAPRGFVKSASPIYVVRPTQASTTQYPDFVKRLDGYFEYTFEVVNERETIDIPIIKTWNDDNNRDGLRKTAAFEAFVRVKGSDDPFVSSGRKLVIDASSAIADNPNEWRAVFEKLSKYSAQTGEELEYSIREISIPEGYQQSSPAENAGSPALSSTEENRVTEAASFVNTHQPQTTSLSVSKQWFDSGPDHRPEQIQVDLYADDQPTGQSLTLNKENGWNGAFENLFVYQNGEKITYTIREQDCPGYRSLMAKTDTGYRLSNIETMSFSGRKVWDDANNQDGIRPKSVVVQLKVGTRIVRDITLSEETGWDFTFENLPRYDKQGEEIDYLLDEAVVAGYSKSVGKAAGEDVWILTNTHVPAVTSLSGTKVWDDQDDAAGMRPESITLRVLADGVEQSGGLYEKTVTADENGQWSWSFENLPVYHDGGKEIKYTVDEEEVRFYDKSFENNTIINTYVPELTEVSVSKVWEDDDNRDGLRPESVQAVLYKNGTATDKTAQLSAENNWSAVFENLEKFENKARISWSVQEAAVAKGYQSSLSGSQSKGFVITNTHEAETTSISGRKVWQDDDNRDGLRPDSITITLLADGQEAAQKTVTAQDNWSFSFDNLLKYRDGGTAIVYTLKEDAVDGYQSSIGQEQAGEFVITNTHGIETTAISGKKVWNDDNNRDGLRPESIAVTLLADGTETAQRIVSANDNWTFSFDSLPKYRDGGTAIVYTVKEDSVAGYQSDISGDADAGFVITNTHDMETTNISGKKVWEDDNNRDGLRPDSITITLMADGTETAQRIVSAEDNWTFSFDNLPKLRDGGTAIAYTVKEDSVSGYQSDISGDADAGFVITNTHDIETTSVSGKKVWDDDNNRDGLRPDSITITLMADGKEAGQKTVTEEDNWAFSFVSLPKYRDGGTAIVYTLKEDAVSGYQSSISGDADAGFVITNTHDIETVNISGKKVWDDDDNRDGLRPDSITITLLADGKKAGQKTVNAEDNWAFCFDGLPKLRDGGTAIVYTLKEETVSGYQSSISGDADAGFVITNTHDIETTSVSGKKVWNDDDNRDGLRPDSITITLLADGKEAAQKTVNAEDDWAFCFDGLPKYRDGGTAIVYTLKEDAVAGYQSDLSGDASAGFVITNTHEIATVNLSGLKVWEDEDNRDGLRPESITLHLLADGKEVVEKTVTESEDWSFAFDSLPKFSQGGAPIVYTVEEDAVPGYRSVISQTMETSFTITNIHECEVVNLGIEKVWEDNDDASGTRPVSITVRLHADGREIDSRSLEADNRWKARFENLPKFRNEGTEIQYTMQEDPNDQYQSRMENGRVINTYNKDTTQVMVSKVWVDDDNRDGLRPESIEVTLLVNGVASGQTLTLSEDNQWQGSFDNLPIWKSGSKAEYTIQESRVAGYASSIEEIAENVFEIENRHDAQMTEISGTKTWTGHDPHQQAVIRLFADGEEIDHKVLTAETGWNYTFEGLPVNNRQKAAIVYTLSEDPIENWTPVWNGFDVENVYTPEKTAIPVIKRWENDTSSQRPESIAIVLLENGKETDRTLILNEENQWSGQFDNLEADKEYSVKELDVPGYQSRVEGDAKEGFVIVNTRNDTPDNPDAPQPDNPDNPDTPDTPDAPDAPKKPTDPKKPETPDKPVSQPTTKPASARSAGTGAWQNPGVWIAMMAGGLMILLFLNRKKDTD